MKIFIYLKNLFSNIHASSIFRLYLQVFLFLSFSLLFFSFLRLGFISVLSANISRWGVEQIFYTLFDGARYDGRILGAVTLAYAALYIIFFFTVKRKVILLSIVGVLFFIQTFLTVSNITYYQIYNDTFNAQLLGLFFDDQAAMLKTAQNANYNIALKFLVVIFLTVGALYIYSKLYRLIDRVEVSKKILNIVLAPLLIYTIFLVLSSSFNLVGGDLKYLVTLPVDRLLKKSVKGPLDDLNDVLIAYNNTKNESFEGYSNGKKIDEVLSLYFGDNSSKGKDVYNLMEHEVKEGNSSNAPKHIFLIVMESLSAYHLSPDFQKLGFGKKLFASIDNNSIKIFPHFAADGFGTIQTLDTLITGLYPPNVAVSNNLLRLPLLQTSPAYQLNELGYDSNFYIFGSSAWRNIEEYVKKEGFINFYAMENMRGARTHTWGVYDIDGYNFIKSNLNTDKPSFNFIVTTENHPPYDIPYKDLAAPKEEIEAFLKAKYPKYESFEPNMVKILSTTFHSLFSVASFVEEMNKKLEGDVLFIITGDHSDRRILEAGNNIAVNKLVPLIIAGKNVEKYSFKYLVGTHLDILPTILELISPKGHKYYSFGSPLLTKNRTEPDLSRVVIGDLAVLTTRYISDGLSIEYFANAEKKDNDLEEAKSYLMLRSYGRAISYYLLNNK